MGNTKEDVIFKEFWRSNERFADLFNVVVFGGKEVITLTLYYGEKQWDGSYCLKVMIVEMPEEIAAIFSDYKMNLLEVRDSAKYVFNNADVQSVFEITREALAGHFDRIREKYGEKELDSELLTVIGQMTGSKELVNMGRNMEVNNMCTALEKLKEDGKMEG